MACKNYGKYSAAEVLGFCFVLPGQKFSITLHLVYILITFISKTRIQTPRGTFQFSPLRHILLTPSNRTQFKTWSFGKAVFQTTNILVVNPFQTLLACHSFIKPVLILSAQGPVP